MDDVLVGVRGLRVRGDPSSFGSPRTDSLPPGWSTTYNHMEDISAPNRESTTEFASQRSGLSDRPGSRSASYA